MVGLEDGSADRHSLGESCNSSFSAQNAPLKDPSDRVGESHVGVGGGKNDKKGVKAEQGAVVKEGVKEGMSVSASAPHSSKSNLQHLSMKTEAEADAEALQQQQEQEDEEGEEEEGVERAKETKVDYRNDTQVSTKEKEKEKEQEKEKKSAQGNLKGSFGVLPSHPPANVEVRTR